MSVTLSPFTLKFSDQHLEHAYQGYRARIVLFPTQKAFATLDLIMYLIFIASKHYTVDTFLSLSFPNALGIGVVLFFIGHLWLMWYIETDTWIQHRTFLTFFFRTCRTLLLCLGSRLYPFEPQRGFLFIFLILGHLLMNSWIAIGMPLLFSEIFWIHVVNVLGDYYFTVPLICNALLSDSEYVPLFVRFWNIVNRILMAIAGFVNAEDMKLDSDLTQMTHNCRVLVFVMQLNIAFGFPILILWNLEFASRLRYLSEQHRQGRWRGTQIGTSIWTPDFIFIIRKRSLLPFLLNCFLVALILISSACWVFLV